jgi:hypothetical protein
MRNVQLICFQWFAAKRARIAPPEPNFIDILHRIALASYSTPLLPQPLYLLVNPKPTPKSSGSNAMAPTQTLVTNDTPDSHLLSLIPFNRKLKDIIGTTQPPMTDTNDPICLSFHAKGACFSNCRQAKNHAHILSMAEKERLENYLVDHLEKTNP